MADLFDSVMNEICSILARTAGVQDAAGLTPRTLTTIDSGVPCRVSRLTGDELKGVKEISIRNSKIYMRPWAMSGSGLSGGLDDVGFDEGGLDDGGTGIPFYPRSSAEAAGAIELNTDMSILVRSRMYNIKHVANPSLAYHHFEVLVEEVT